MFNLVIAIAIKPKAPLLAHGSRGAL